MDPLSVTIQQPQWSLETQQPIRQNPDGSFLRVGVLQIKSGFSAENLLAAATGDNDYIVHNCQRRRYF
jgi:hypothetical protein